MNLRSTGAPGARPRANAITVDVEEWFHICGVSPLSHEHWDSLPVARRPHHAGAARGTRSRRRPRARSSCSAGSLNAIRTWSAEIRAAGHDIGSHGHLHARVYELDCADVRCGPETERRGAARRRCRAHRRVQGTRVVDQRSGRCGRSSASFAKASRSTQAWRRSASWAASTTRACRTCGARLRVPSSRFHHWSSIVSGTPCRSGGDGGCA